MSDIEWLTHNGYKLVTRTEFETAKDIPIGLFERAKRYAGAWVVYDPYDDSEGYMLIGDDKDTIANEACNFLNP